MKNKIDKKKIIKYSGAGLLATYLTTFGAMHLYDSHVDHLHEYCKLNNILGVEHQIDKINNDYRAYGIGAYYADETISQEYAAATLIQTKDEQTIYTVPSGYTLEGNVGVRTIHNPERIVITQGTPIYPKGTQPGNLVKKSDIEIEESEDIYSIPVPTKTK